MRLGLVTAVAAATAFGAGAAFGAGPAALGLACQAQSQTIVVKGQVLICAPSAGGLRWQRFDKNAAGGVRGSHGSQPGPSGPCPHAGASETVGGTRYVCARRGKLLIWVRQPGGSSSGNGGSSRGGSQGGGNGQGNESGQGGGDNGQGNGNGQGQGGGLSAAQQARPLFENLGVTFGAWDRSTNRAGDFLFGQASFPTRGPVSPFADSVSSGGGGSKLTSEIGWDYLRPDAPVVAVTDGIITATNFQSDTNDYEVWEQTVQGSEWTVIYDHVQNLKVAKGTQVTAGTQIGTPPPQAGSAVSFTELQVVQSVDPGNQQQIHTQWCATTFLDPKVRDTLLAQIRQLESDWQSFKGDQTIYAQAEVVPGCYQQSYQGG